MNETLSNEEIQDYLKGARNVEKYPCSSDDGKWDNSEFLKALNTIKHLKTQLIMASKTIKSVGNGYTDTQKQLETKDAQIKQLVEALDKVDEMVIDIGSALEELKIANFINDVRHTIPDVEGYRLEREVVEACKSLFELPVSNLLNKLGGLEDAYKALEAHREKVKSSE
jgi:hypothetical protein